MTARVLIVKNIQREGPGLFRDVLLEHRVGADVIEIEKGDSIPSLDEYGALVVLGGPPSANDDTELMRAELLRVAEAVETGMPYLGICLGHQVLAKAAGAAVVQSRKKEVGFFQTNAKRFTVKLTGVGRRDALFDGVPDEFPVFQLHGETVKDDERIEVLASGASSSVQAIRVGRRAYGLQMHVEVVPEMLAVWRAQDPDLESFEASELQQQLSEVSAEYIRTGRRIFANFLAIAGLINAVDLTGTQGQSGPSERVNEEQSDVR